MANFDSRTSRRFLILSACNLVLGSLSFAIELTLPFGLPTLSFPIGPPPPSLPTSLPPIGSASTFVPDTSSTPTVIQAASTAHPHRSTTSSIIIFSSSSSPIPSSSRSSSSAIPSSSQSSSSCSLPSPITTSLTTFASLSFFSSLSSVSSSSSSLSYFTTVTGASSFPTSSNYSSSLNLHKNAIVGGVVGGGTAVIVIVIAIVVYSSKRKPKKQFSRVFDDDRNSRPNEPRVSEGGGIGGHITAANTWVQVDTLFRSSDVITPYSLKYQPTTPTTNSSLRPNSHSASSVHPEMAARFVAGFDSASHGSCGWTSTAGSMSSPTGVSYRRYTSDRTHSDDAETSSPSREELDVGEQEHVPDEIPPTYESLVPQAGGSGIRNEGSRNVMRGGSRCEGGVGGNKQEWI
ncbi:hypothetical protein F5876DRAFT_78901 [Lentinula aff. lateritia]|uniref:Uncharacterized protein n=1 Tax=Lentinula aff. lateritia TaxID=2804960 RepID=A0ACC1TU39_9AGAR|nr:hypothetical protein F5876DRAFT_78901 [Lentinula aff. lateritia]